MPFLGTSHTPELEQHPGHHAEEPRSKSRPGEWELAGLDPEQTEGQRIERIPPREYREVKLSDDHETYFRRWVADLREDFKKNMRRRDFTIPSVDVRRAVLGGAR